MFSVEEDRCRGVGKSDFYQIIEKVSQAGQKGFSCEARGFRYSCSLFVFVRARARETNTISARRSSATKQMSLFQQPVYDSTIRKSVEKQKVGPWRSGNGLTASLGREDDREKKWKCRMSPFLFQRENKRTKTVSRVEDWRGVP